MGRRASWMSGIVFLLPFVAAAQVPGLVGPEVSPEATVTQKVGVTEIAVSYHRPADRHLIGALF